MPQNMNWTPLIVAADRGYLDIVVFLVYHGAVLEPKNNNGCSALNSAVKKGHQDIVQYLLGMGVDVDTVQSCKCTPLMIASKEGFVGIVDMLLDYGAEVEHRNMNGYTALLDAAMEGHVEIVELLLARGANIEAGNLKLSGFGLYTYSLHGVFSKLWDAPEVLSGQVASFESDVYSLGMCIIEAVSGSDPYALEVSSGLDIENLKKNGVGPTRPTGFTESQWDFVKELIRFQPKRKQETWRTLYEAALGLQYLHDRGVIHCDLKCNNFLIGRDGKTKVSDYGLSRSQQHQGPVSALATGSTTDDQQSTGASNGIGAPRWKAPEILSGAAPTPESDVYAFGMCVVEAMTGEFPWGNTIRDELISDHVMGGGHLFSKPRCFSDEQWDLVVGACRFNPQERTSLSEIVSKLRDFARDSSSIDELVEPEPELPEMRSDADSGCREDSEDDEFAPPVNNANANRFVDEDDDL
ncbi:hypothetical protein ATCC90586_008672 [Pythium insidiosum]|nr:hypothetical protein ATCC90586_008672 [Pythium insidiosum]